MKFDDRELKELYHALHYAEWLHSGITGHNSYMLLAKLAQSLGFEIDENHHQLLLNSVVILQL